MFRMARCVKDVREMRHMNRMNYPNHTLPSPPPSLTFKSVASRGYFSLIVLIIAAWGSAMSEPLRDMPQAASGVSVSSPALVWRNNKNGVLNKICVSCNIHPCDAKGQGTQMQIITMRAPHQSCCSTLTKGRRLVGVSPCCKLVTYSFLC